MTGVSKHTISVWENVTHIGAGKCSICKTMQADCVQFRAGFFSNAIVCDGCASAMMRMFRRGVGGEVKR